MLGLGCAGAAVAYLLPRRHAQIAALSPTQRAEFETWDRVRYLRSCINQGKLHSYLPGPVLEELEAIARKREDALADVRAHAREAPEAVAELRTEVDAILADAIAAAASVTRSSSQSGIDVGRWESDPALMRHVVARGRRFREQIESIIQANALGGGSGVSLRETLSRARLERVLAERELEQALSGDSS